MAAESSAAASTSMFLGQHLPLLDAPSLPPPLLSSALSSSSSLMSLSDTDAWFQQFSLSTKYEFMFPIAIAVAVCCQLSGIGGAALMSPIFLLVFPLIGPEYPLPNPANAIATALLTEVFGFASGLSGYARKQLIDWKISRQFAAVSMPAALVGAILAKVLASDVTLLRVVYALFMLGLSTYLFTSEAPEALEKLSLDDGCDIPESMMEDGKPLPIREKTSSTGQSFTYLEPSQGNAKSTTITSSGGLLTGLLGVGIGEVILPQLVRKCCMPLPVAAGTSVAIVVLTALTAAIVQFLNLSYDLGGPSNIVSIIPWDLVQYTIPGAVIGGQIAPVIASKGIFSDEDIETFVASLFAVIGAAFAAKVILG